MAEHDLCVQSVNSFINILIPRHFALQRKREERNKIIVKYWIGIVMACNSFIFLSSDEILSEIYLLVSNLIKIVEFFIF